MLVLTKHFFIVFYTFFRLTIPRDHALICATINSFNLDIKYVIKNFFSKLNDFGANFQTFDLETVTYPHAQKIFGMDH